MDLKELTVKDEERILVSSFSLSLLDNQSIVLMGPGGSGKSLIRKFILGETLPSLSYTTNTYQKDYSRAFVLNANNKVPENKIVPTYDHDLYVFDEPDKAYSLDEFRPIYGELRANQKSILICTHHLGFVREFSDQICFIKYGVTRGFYTPKEFFNNTDPEIAYIARMGC